MWTNEEKGKRLMNGISQEAPRCRHQDTDPVREPPFNVLHQFNPCDLVSPPTARLPLETYLSQQVNRSDFDKYMQEKFDSSLDMGGDLDDGMRKYLADVWVMDLQIGMILERLTQLGVLDDTIIIFSSDHGAAPIMPGYQAFPFNMMGYMGGLRGAKHEFYEGGVRTPFIVRWPGMVPAGKVNRESTISALDWLPTISSIAGAPYDRDMFDGEDVSDIWFGSDRSRVNPIFWKRSSKKADKVMLYGPWKLFTGKKNSELYNLRVNPAEDENVYDANPDVVGAFRAQLELWDSTLPEEYRNFKDTSKLPFDPKEPPAKLDLLPQLLEIGKSSSLSMSSSDTLKFTVSPTSALTVYPTAPPTAPPTATPTATPTTVYPTAPPTETATTVYPTAPPTAPPTATPTMPPTVVTTKDPPTHSLTDEDSSLTTNKEPGTPTLSLSEPLAVNGLRTDEYLSSASSSRQLVSSIWVALSMVTVFLW